MELFADLKITNMATLRKIKDRSGNFKAMKKRIICSGNCVST
jgi:hypothetical protein